MQFLWRRCLHKVTHAEGPERIAMEWWRSAGLTRDYFRVETAGGLRFWLYRDGLYQGSPLHWYMHGFFA